VLRRPRTCANGEPSRSPGSGIPPLMLGVATLDMSACYPCLVRIANLHRRKPRRRAHGHDRLVAERPCTPRHAWLSSSWRLRSSRISSALRCGGRLGDRLSRAVRDLPQRARDKALLGITPGPTYTVTGCVRGADHRGDQHGRGCETSLDRRQASAPHKDRTSHPRTGCQAVSRAESVPAGHAHPTWPTNVALLDALTRGISDHGWWRSPPRPASGAPRSRRSGTRLQALSPLADARLVGTVLTTACRR